MTHLVPLRPNHAVSMVFKNECSSFFPLPVHFVSFLGGRQTCSITIWNDGQVGATYTSQNAFIVEWEGAGPVESFNCILRQDDNTVSSNSCKLLIVQYLLTSISTVICTNSTPQALHHLNRVLLSILGITLWRFSQWGALVEYKDQPSLDQWSSPIQVYIMLPEL